jgi:alkylation response protein AidB-like acyl-CoA dehydrogenase
MTLSLEFATRLDEVTQRFADDAAAVDRADLVPAGHLDALAELGLYGVFAPTELGGLGFEVEELCEVVEQLASGCLASTFVWIQHLRLLGTVLNPTTPAHLREHVVDVIGGTMRGGVALGGLLPGPARLRAIGVEGGWTLDGHAPWVSGWGLVDTLFVAARGPEETVVTALVPAREQAGLEASPWHLAAMNASATVRLDFTSLFVSSDDVVGIVPFDPASERPEGLRVNGSLALGLARRCCSLLGPSPLDDALRRCRENLDRGDATSMADARAAASQLAVTAAHALAVQHGSSSVVAGDVAERAQREAALLLTFGSRPAIRAALLERFNASTATD